MDINSDINLGDEDFGYMKQSYSTQKKKKTDRMVITSIGVG